MCYDNIAQVYILISDVIHLIIQETDNWLENKWSPCNYIS